MKPAWTFVTYAESDSEPGVEYVIDRRPDGAYRCACLSFRFARGLVGTPGKSCRHLRAYLAGLAGDTAALMTAAGLARPADVRTVRIAAETFTFRRAIAFGGLKAGGAR